MNDSDYDVIVIYLAALKALHSEIATARPVAEVTS
jgi:hypothetical protein